MEKKQIKKTLLKIVVSAVLITLLLRKIDLNDLLSKISAMDLRYVPLILVLISLNYYVSSVRWKKLLIFENTDKISVNYLVKLYFVGSFFNNFMPTSIGGDVYKILKLGNKIQSKTNAFAATFMERFLGVVALLLISVFSIFSILNKQIIALVFLGIIGICVSYLLLKFLYKKNNKVKKVIDNILLYKKYKNELIFAFFFSFLVQLFSIFSQYLIFVSLGVHPPLVYSMFILPLITLAGFFIPSLNGIGVQDTLYLSFFTSVGIPGAICLTSSILYHISRLFISLIGGVFYAFENDK